MSPFKTLFMGTSDFAVPALRALVQASYPVLSVVTQPDRPAGRGLELRPSPVKRAALELGLPVFQPEKVKAPDAVEALRALKPDVMVVAAYGQILPKAVLEIPPIACLNIHGSLLPRWRGAAPIHYALMAGDAETGVTLMYMNEKMDEGDILLAERTRIGAGETTGEVHDRLARLGAQALLRALELLAQGKAPRVPQDSTLATYANSIKKENCLIVWSRPSVEIVQKISAFYPWPMSETVWKDMTLKVIGAESVSGDKLHPIDQVSSYVGKVLRVDKNGILVRALSGAVLIKKIQPPGKRPMNAYDFTLGHPDFKIGEQLK